jgi:hypothetical protein
MSLDQHLSNFGDLSWVVIYVNADFDPTFATYASIDESDFQPLQIAKTEPDTQYFDPGGIVMGQQDGSWTHIFHSVGEYNEFPVKLLAARLNCRCIVYSAEDTSGVVDCTKVTPDGNEVRYQTAADQAIERDLRQSMSDSHMQDAKLLPGSVEEFLVSEGIVILTPFSLDQTTVMLPELQIAQVSEAKGKAWQ